MITSGRADGNSLRFALSQPLKLHVHQQGDRAVVSTDEITEFLSLYERAANTDRAGFVKRVHASIEKIKKHSILQKIRSSEDRFEISPTLKLLFSAEEIQALTHLYQRMAAGETPAQLTQTDADEEADQ